MSQEYFEMATNALQDAKAAIYATPVSSSTRDMATNINEIVEGTIRGKCVNWGNFKNAKNFVGREELVEQVGEINLMLLALGRKSVVCARYNE